MHHGFPLLDVMEAQVKEAEAQRHDRKDYAPLSTLGQRGDDLKNGGDNRAQGVRDARYDRSERPQESQSGNTANAPSRKAAGKPRSDS